jgi:prephenate dehydrogenase
MWRDVCISNGDALVNLIEQYQQELNRVKAAISAEDADELLKLFGRAKSERDSLIGNC